MQWVVANKQFLLPAFFLDDSNWYQYHTIQIQILLEKDYITTSCSFIIHSES